MKNDLVIAGLLHDIGKIIYRTGRESGNHSVLGANFLKEINDTQLSGVDVFSKNIINAVRYHHAKELNGAKIEDNSIAYLVYEADNISAGIDRRESEEVEGEEESKGLFDKYTPLQSIYNILNGKSEDKYYSEVTPNLIKDFVIPSEKADLTSGHYIDILNKIKTHLSQIKRTDYKEGYINSLLELIKSTLYFIPSSTNTKELSDISLYSHSKLTASIASSMYDFFTENKRMDFKKEVFSNDTSFRDEDAFLMVSLDVSGIQKFIYTITTDSAQKQLRSRSAYVELIMENLIDEILSELNYSRCNLLYSGGGHSYLLIGNTNNNKNKIKSIIEKQNEWFIDNLGVALHVSVAIAECSANDLSPNKKSDSFRYKKIFNSLGKQLAESKLTKYSLNQIITLNKNNETNGRECRVCGLVSKSSKDICYLCESLVEYGSEFLKKDSVFIFTKESNLRKKNLKMFSYKNGSNYMQVYDKSNLDIDEKDLIKQYSKNSFDVGKNRETVVFMGDYSVKNYTFSDYAKNSVGINRLGVLRADVDDLGKAFVSGFDNSDDEKSTINYSTISRTSAFSESLSMFFKYYINDILKNKGGKYKKISITNSLNKDPRNLSVVYSGGDDLFVAGSWNDVLEFAIDLNNLFKQFTQNKLTLSAGFGIFNANYPISQIATITGGLENLSKLKSKNKITLFDEYDDYVFSWEELEQNVIKEKLHYLLNYYSNKSNSNNGSSNMSQIYKILEHLRNINKDENNKAKLAYTLARMQESMTGKEKKERELTKNLYTWASNKKDRKQLITAFMLLVYLNRGE